MFDGRLKERLRAIVSPSTWDTVRENYYRFAFSDRGLIEHQYKAALGRKPELRSPETFNDKLQWLKLYWRDDLATRCSDKMAVRDYVSSRIGSEVLNGTYGAYERVDDIPWDELPDACVFKATHGSGWNIFCHDRHTADRLSIMATLSQWLRRNHFWMTREWVYRDIHPRVLIEEMLVGENGGVPTDYKVFCFHGQPAFIQVDLDRFGNHRRNIYDLDWQLLPLSIKFPRAPYANPAKPPLALMLAMSRDLAAPFVHVRVDWFVVNGELRFGEMTFFHGGGIEKFSPEEWGLEFGRRIDLSRCKS
jgi:teichuronopeptide biosynthesis TupA-like protein